MSRWSENAIPFLLLLVYLTLFTENSLVVGSPISDNIAKRPDPLCKFKHYAGDYDLRDKHYWASAAFTGIHGYAVAGLWLLSGVGFGIFILVKNLSGSPSQATDDQHPNSMTLTMLLLILMFTIFAIAASSVAIAANQKSLQRAKKLEETIFGAGDDAFHTITKLKVTLRNVHALLLPYDSRICNLLDYIGHRLRKESLNINSFMEKTRKSCDQAFKILYLVNLLVMSVNLALLAAGLALLALQYRPGILILIFSCWIITTLSWILTGADFFFYTFIGDSCSTLKDYEEDPQKSNLAEMLPCPKSTDGDKILDRIDYSIHSSIVEINLKIREVLKVDKLNEDQSVPEICNPFSSAPDYGYSPETCRRDSIPIADLPTVLSGFICYNGNNTENCLAEGRFLPEVIYPISLAYSQSIREFIKVYPDISSLMNCSSVKRAFYDIVTRQCRPINFSTKMLWSSTLTLSLVMVVLVLMWSGKAIRDRGRCFNLWSVFRSPIQRI